MYKLLFKRPIDIICALVLLLFLAPLLFVVAILVAIKHGRPIIFKQKRVGRNQKIFWFYKFRSMTNARDENGELLPDSMRVTKFGRFLRKTSIDELPQLWNILKGDMSFIGPRPRDVKECIFLNETQCGRFRVRPGLSGLAQINGRNAITFDKVAEYDNKYADRVTLWGDIKIAFKTLLVVFKKESIDSNIQSTVHLSYYYNDVLLQRGEITQDEYNQRVALSKTLEVGNIMPSVATLLQEGIDKIKNDQDLYKTDQTV